MSPTISSTLLGPAEQYKTVACKTVQEWVNHLAEARSTRSAYYLYEPKAFAFTNGSDSPLYTIRPALLWGASPSDLAPLVPFGITFDLFKEALQRKDLDLLFDHPTEIEPKKLTKEEMKILQDMWLEDLPQLPEEVAPKVELSVYEKAGWEYIDPRTVKGYPVPMPNFLVTKTTGDKTEFYDSFGFFGVLQEGSYVRLDIAPPQRSKWSLESHFYHEKGERSNKREGNHFHSYLLDPPKADPKPKGWFRFTHPDERVPLLSKETSKAVQKPFSGYAKRKAGGIQIIPDDGKGFVADWDKGLEGYAVPSDETITAGGTLAEELAKF